MNLQLSELLRTYVRTAYVTKMIIQSVKSHGMARPPLFSLAHIVVGLAHIVVGFWCLLFIGAIACQNRNGAYWECVSTNQPHVEACTL